MQVLKSVSYPPETKYLHYPNTRQKTNEPKTFKNKKSKKKKKKKKKKLKYKNIIFIIKMFSLIFLFECRSNI